MITATSEPAVFSEIICWVVPDLVDEHPPRRRRESALTVEQAPSCTSCCSGSKHTAVTKAAAVMPSRALSPWFSSPVPNATTDATGPASSPSSSASVRAFGGFLSIGWRAAMRR
ncbi:hypothetical protein [Kineosporia sp. NBRC 101731]|uniref:hypothetical protein n=1 Tax=Kineosporia sp. NBRC 101731 TaxID=3032199 RepID=UPI0024A249D1|nr:hypothetical protein [Kineosporia sp. NBRC 101731]GLY31539.1 hypothetical protein Kisp02_49040 [Kineosporia sp. NBRC 101731]